MEQSYINNMIGKTKSKSVAKESDTNDKVGNVTDGNFSVQ